jgi:hypothetical protein
MIIFGKAMWKLRTICKEVADIVLELTSDNNEIKYKSKTLYLIQKLIKMSDDALIVKLSDRLQNISDAFTTSEKFRKTTLMKLVK